MARFRFVDTPDATLALLEVETPNRRGVVARLRDALFTLRIQVVRMESCVTRGWRRQRLWIVEFDGARIRPARRQEIQQAVAGIVGARAKYLGVRNRHRIAS